MKRSVMVSTVITALIGPIIPSQAQEDDPFGGGFLVKQDYEIFTMGQQADSLHGWVFDWLSDTDSIVWINDGNFPESYACGEDRDIAAADFNGDFMDELVIAWNRTDGGVFVGIPTIDPVTMAIDPGGWHVPLSPVPAGVLYATPVIADVLGEIRVVAGNFYDDPASEFVLAYLNADSMVSLTVFDVDSATLIPVERATISDQAIHTEVTLLQQKHRMNRFDVATGDFDGDGTDEIVLIVSDPAVTPETDLVVGVYDYDTIGHEITPLPKGSITANDSPDHTCLRRLAVTVGNFDSDSADEIALMDRWANPVEDNYRVGTVRILKLNSEMTAITDEQSDPLPDVPRWPDMGAEIGMSWVVYALTVYDNKLIAGGAFERAGGVQVNYIAAWDGSSWSPLGTGMSSHVFALTVYDNKLIAGGQFDNAGGTHVNYIAAWDGSQWQPLETGMSGIVRALTVHNGDLIAGGDFLSADPQGDNINTRRIARWDGSQWHAIEGGYEQNGLSAISRALMVYNGDLIGAGDFVTAYWYGNSINARRIARWDGSQWYAIVGGYEQNGLSAISRALTEYNGDLIAAGDFVYAYWNGNTVSASRIARWDGSQWHSLAGGTSHNVHALTVYNDDLIVGGYFDFADYTNILVRRIARWDGSQWYAMGDGVSATARALAVYDDKLIAAGSFSSAGGKVVNRIAAWDGSDWYPLLPSMEMPTDITAGNFVRNSRGDNIITDELFITACRENSGQTEQYLKVYEFDSTSATPSICAPFDMTVLNSIASASPSGDLYTSRRTLSLGEVTGNEWTDLTMLRADNTGEIEIEVFELYPDMSSACGTDSVITKGSWITESDNMTELVLADIDSTTIRLGKPSYHLVTDMLQPLVVLNAPPSHFDVLDETVYDVNFLLDETPNPQGCETYSVYEKKTGYTMEMSTEVNRDWGVSSSLDVSVGTPGAKVKAHLGANYGESSTWAEESRETIEFTLTANAETDDQIFATQLDYEVWEYPIMRGGVQLEGGGVVVVSPVTSNNIFAASKSSFREQWIPNHEVGNLLSYQKITDDNVLVGSENIICDGTGFVTNDVSDFYWEVIQENFSEHSVEESYTAGMEVGASVSGGGSFFGFSWGVAVSTEFTYSQEEVNTYTTQVTDACLLQAFIGCINTSSSDDRTAIIIPYAYWANNGALVLDYTVQPSAPGGDPSFWQIHYMEPDPAFILPWRLDYEKGDEGMTETARYQTREIIFHPGEPAPGELVTITARVHNFSLIPTSGAVSVSFYLGDPDNGGTLLTDLSAQSVFWTPAPIASQGEQLVSMDWQVPPEGSINRCQRIWAVIDPGNDISEVHDNDDPRTNNKGWKALYVNTDATCIDSDGDGYGDPALTLYNDCHTCLGVDNCPTVYNPEQTDVNGDGIGDDCQGCCFGRVGDANGLGGDEPTIGDVSVMIDAKFITGTCDGIIVCLTEADINQSGGIDPTCDDITIGDISTLIDYLFITGKSLGLADCL